MQLLSELTMLNVWERADMRSRLDVESMLLGAASDTSLKELDDLPLGERDGRLLTLHEQTFGPQLRGYAECPACRESLELELHIPSLRAAPPPSCASSERFEHGGYV